WLASPPERRSFTRSLADASFASLNLDGARRPSPTSRGESSRNLLTDIDLLAHSPSGPLSGTIDIETVGLHRSGFRLHRSPAAQLRRAGSRKLELRGNRKLNRQRSHSRADADPVRIHRPDQIAARFGPGPDPIRRL